MKTEDGNKLIAEFMGYTYHPVTDEWTFEHPKDGTAVIWKGNDLPYDTLWNWLMPVVEKIEALDRSRFEFRIGTLGVDVYDYAEENQPEIVNVSRYENETKIEMTYDAVIQFIQWHNQITSPLPK